MEILNTPWRMDYIQQTARQEGCVFCNLLRATRRDAERFILHRGTDCFLVMNIYPYTPGHLLAIPYTHAAQLGDFPPQVCGELLALCRLGERLLRRAFGCRSVHIGANLGQAAGAGVPGHLHFHIVAWPEGQLWDRCVQADALPERLETTYARLRAILDEHPPADRAAT